MTLVKFSSRNIDDKSQIILPVEKHSQVKQLLKYRKRSKDLTGKKPRRRKKKIQHKKFNYGEHEGE